MSDSREVAKIEASRLLEHFVPGLDGLYRSVPFGVEEFVRAICNRFGLDNPWPAPKPEPTSVYDEELKAVGAKSGAFLGDIRQGVRPDDSWKHRSSNMRCSTCMWYVPKASAPREVLGQTAHIVEETPIGRCRRHAPAMGGYPVVKRDDWCGDHRLDENKS